MQKLWFILLFFTLILVIFLVSCTETNHKIYYNTDNIKVIHNNGNPTEEFQFSFKKIFEIKPDSLNHYFSPIGFPSYDGNKLVFNRNLQNYFLYIFDTNGILIKRTLKKGQGPKEVSTNLLDCIVDNDTIYVIDMMKKQYLLTSNGDFLKEKRVNNEERLIFKIYKKFTDNSFLILSASPESDGSWTYKISRVDSNFQTVRTFFTYFEKTIRFLFKYEVTFNDQYIFIAEKGFSNYEIHVFSNDGEKQYIIRKSYRDISYTDKELEDIKNKIQLNGEEKWIIRSLNTDRFGRLWVETGYGFGKDYFLTDIFKDGIYQNTIKIPLSGYSYKIRNNILMLLDFDNESLTGYDIEYSE